MRKRLADKEHPDFLVARQRPLEQLLRAEAAKQSPRPAIDVSLKGARLEVKLVEGDVAPKWHAGAILGLQGTVWQVKLDACCGRQDSTPTRAKPEHACAAETGAGLRAESDPKRRRIHAEGDARGRRGGRSGEGGGGNDGASSCDKLLPNRCANMLPSRQLSSVLAITKSEGKQDLPSRGGGGATAAVALGRAAGGVARKDKGKDTRDACESHDGAGSGKGVAAGTAGATQEAKELGARKRRHEQMVARKEEQAAGEARRARPPPTARPPTRPLPLSPTPHAPPKQSPSHQPASLSASAMSATQRAEFAMRLAVLQKVLWR